MRTKLTLVAAALAVITACTVKNFEPPQLAGPSTFAKDLYLTATPDVLTQNGVDQAQVRVSAKGPNGSPVAGMTLKAEIRVNNIVQDFGTLSSKTRVTDTDGTAVFTYTAAPLPTFGTVPASTTVQIAVTPVGADSGTELPRVVDIKLIPQGVIAPFNPDLVPDFTFAPAAPLAFTNVAFDASLTKNGTTACGISCVYFWNFGDNSTGSGIGTTHQYRTAGTFQVTLSAIDNRGAQANVIKTVTVSPAAAPANVEFTMSPTPAVVDQAIFFNAGESKAAPGRTLVSYEWDFGKGSTGTGVTVSHVYDVEGTYTITLKVTDDAGATGTKSHTLTVTNPQPKPDFTIIPTSPAVGQLVVVNGSSTTGPSPIVSYLWDFGVGSSPSSGTGVSASTTYSGTIPATRVITLTVTDSAGRTATISKQVTIAP